MKIVGFTFVRNCVKYDYPFIESIKSLLPICDELIIVAGNSEDQTLKRIESLKSSKIRLFHSVWDETLREGGKILAQQTNIALDNVEGDWAIYLQADEIIHEHDYSKIISAMESYSESDEVEGLLFNYKHFYGSYDYIGDSRRWYRHEIRVVRPLKGLRSWGDAQGFRIDGRKLHVKKTNASIYHYGWVKPPLNQQLKQMNFHKLWHSDDWVKANVGSDPEYDYRKGGQLKLFEGSHPVVMKERVQSQDWQFRYDPNLVKCSLKEKILNNIERISGFRIGEYKNYIII